MEVVPTICVIVAPRENHNGRSSSYGESFRFRPVWGVDQEQMIELPIGFRV